MSNTSLLGSYGAQDNSSIIFRNKLYNGCFRVWQRGTSQTATGYGSDDRWINDSGGSTKTHSRQTFAVGQTEVPGNPEYYSRTVVSSVAGAGNLVAKAQKIESVRTFAGQTATLSFWAKADAPKNMAVEFIQNFGSGGTPSTRVTEIGVTTIALTTSWKYYTVTVNIPSIAGKTIGTDGNDNIQLAFWFDAGSNFNSRTNSLGQQSGTFDIAQVQMEAGPVATPFEHRPIGLEAQLCQRYYESRRIHYRFFTTASGQYLRVPISFAVVKRTVDWTKTVILSDANGLTYSGTNEEKSADAIWLDIRSTAATASSYWYGYVTIDAEL